MAARTPVRWLLGAALLATVLPGCGDEGSSGPHGVDPAPFGEPYATLAEWGLFEDTATQTPAEGVVPYDVNSPLFSDYAWKFRFMWIPPGTHIGYSPDGRWDFPVGTILVKTFSFPVDARDPSLGLQLMETRLLINEGDDWSTNTYVYQDGGRTTVRKVAGDIIPVSWIDEAGDTVTDDYVVPNTNECRTCHGAYPNTGTLGGKTRQLDRDFDYPSGTENQLDHLTALGWLEGAPPAAERIKMPDPFGSAPVSDRARAYLDANCSHCHSPTGGVSDKLLFLDWFDTDPATDDPTNWGICKIPTSAGGATCGYDFDVVPGEPDLSILICRVDTDVARRMMPPLGRNLIHTQAVSLLREWIAGMPPGSCTP